MLDKEKRKEIISNYIREVFNQTDAEIAKIISNKIGVANTTVYGWLGNKCEIPLDTLYLLSAFFDFISVEEIFRRMK